MSCYLVFARTSYEEPVACVGRVGAGDDDVACVDAADLYGDGAIEVVLVPVDAASWIVGADQEVAAGG